ncbi:MAG: TonB-dependent receptor [Caulobacteraceae bacterium]
MSLKIQQLGLRALAYAPAAAALVLAAGLASPVLAAEDTVTSLPDLLITAERREENLQDVSLSATVMNDEQIAAQGVNRIADLQQVSPSLVINTYNRSTFINIRGVGIAQSAPTSSPGVAYYVNGALIPHEQTIGLTFFDIDSIEVLRGPQGTLSGQNSTGGAIYVRTPAPQFDRATGYIDNTFGDYSWWRAIGAVNIPLTDNLAVRVSAVRDTRASFTTNIGPSPYTPGQNNPSQPGNVNLIAGRLAVRYQAMSNLEFNFRYEVFRSDTDFNAIKRRNDVVSTDPFVIEEDAISRQLLKGYRVDGEAAYDITDGIRLRWITSYQSYQSEDVSDGDRTATAPPRPPNSNVGRIGYALTGFNTITHEFDVLSTDENSPLEWVVGGFYLQEDIPVLLLRYQLSTVFRNTAPTSTTQTRAINMSRSVFGQAGWRFNDQWKVIAGLRYTEDSQRYQRILTAGATGLAQSSVTTGRAAVEYTPNDNLMIYGSYSKGYKAGGVNLGVLDPAILPETNYVTELGFKSTLFDGQLRLNGAVYSSQYKNIQLGSIQGAPPAPIILNVPKSAIFGAELEATGVYGQLQYNVGVAYLSGELRSAATLSDNTVTPSVAVVVPAGEDLPFAPHWTFTAGIQYTFNVWDGTITPRLQYVYIADQFATPFHQTLAQQLVTRVPARNVVDLRVTWQPSDYWRVEGFATNLFDETYIASQVQNSSSADGGIIYGAPRQIGLRVVFQIK